MTREILSKLRVTGTEQLAALREGNIAKLEQLEVRRTELLKLLQSEELAAAAASDPDGVGEELRAILENDRLVQTALRGRIEERREAMKQIDKRLSAEKAYRKMSA